LIMNHREIINNTKDFLNTLKNCTSNDNPPQITFEYSAKFITDPVATILNNPKFSGYIKFACYWDLDESFKNKIIFYVR